eukprot:4409332-Pyramimonas_sp.AAC.1
MPPTRALDRPLGPATQVAGGLLHAAGRVVLGAFLGQRVHCLVAFHHRAGLALELADHRPGAVHLDAPDAADININVLRVVQDTPPQIHRGSLLRYAPCLALRQAIVAREDATRWRRSLQRLQEAPQLCALS